MKQRKEIEVFLKDALSQSGRIILTGAGTSAYIGLSLKGFFQERTGLLTEAIATTDIVSHPSSYFISSSPLLMVSFARSGDSPESVEALKLADELTDTCFHLVITCNSEGGLAAYQSKSHKYVINLPDEANDRSLAMTSSYSSMLLVGLLIAGMQDIDVLKKDVLTVAYYAQRFIETHAGDIRKLATLNFKRAVFLGGGPFFGTATEAQLKLQELTDGKVISKNDTYLGFRHGPKSVTDETTLVMYFFSQQHRHAFNYEKDLVKSMHKGIPPLIEVGISETMLPGIELHEVYAFGDDTMLVEEEVLLTLCYIIPAQMLGFFKSIEMGLAPDQPSDSNAITRVVEGVQIYEI